MPQHEGLSWLPFWGQRMEAEPREEGGAGRRRATGAGGSGQQAWALLHSSLVGGQGRRACGGPP